MRLSTVYPGFKPMSQKVHNRLHIAKILVNYGVSPTTEIDCDSVPCNFPLTINALKHYRINKDDNGYATFIGLSTSDILSVLSAAKRHEAHVTVDRMGNCAFYKLKKK